MRSLSISKPPKPRKNRTMTEHHELTIKKTIRAERQKVFDAWLHAETLQQFMCPAPGVSVPRAEANGTEGGSFLIVMQAGDKEIEHRGVYEVIQPHDKLVFTWLSNHSGPDSKVTLTFTEPSPGETELTLHHAGLPSVESRDNHKGGWSSILDLLGSTLS